MNSISLFVLILFFLVCQAKKREISLPGSPEVIELTRSNWDAYIDGTKDFFVEFYVPWCHHCEKLAPILDQVANHYKNNPFAKIGRVNAEKQLPLSVKYQVAGYPTLILFSREKEEVYKGKRDNAQSFISWLDKRNFGADLTKPLPPVIKDTHIPPPNLKEEAKKLITDPQARSEKQAEINAAKAEINAAKAEIKASKTEQPEVSPIQIEAPLIKPEPVDELLLLHVEPVFVDEISAENEPVTPEFGPKDLENTIDGFFYGKDDVSLYWQAWLKPSQKESCIVLLHGLGDHSNRYKQVASQLNEKGFSVYSFDFRGHGRSGGDRGHLNEWEEIREDLSKFVQLVHQKENPGAEIGVVKTPKKITIIGHDLGATAALEYLLHPLFYRSHKDLVNGIVLLSPLLENNSTNQIESDSFGGMIDTALASLLPTLTQDQSDTQLTKLSGDVKKLREIKSDPLFHFEVSYRFLAELKTAQEKIQEHLARLPVSILIQHGGIDQIAPSSTSQALYQKIIFPELWKSEQKKRVKQRYSKSFKVYPNSHHRLLDDLDVNDVTNDLIHWIENVPL